MLHKLKISFKVNESDTKEGLMINGWMFLKTLCGKGNYYNVEASAGTNSDEF